MPARITGMIGSQQVGIAVHLIKGKISREWVVDFTRLGARFNSHAMVNRDHLISGNSRDLERRNFRVKLAITPTIVKRDVSGAALLVVALHHAHVILMT